MSVTGSERYLRCLTLAHLFPCTAPKLKFWKASLLHRTLLVKPSFFHNQDSIPAQTNVPPDFRMPILTRKFVPKIQANVDPLSSVKFQLAHSILEVPSTITIEHLCAMPANLKLSSMVITHYSLRSYGPRTRTLW